VEQAQAEGSKESKNLLIFYSSAEEKKLLCQAISPQGPLILHVCV
jgi:hypothetical protein